MTYPRNLIEFTTLFPDEDTCWNYLVKARWPNGFKCPVCGYGKYWFIETRYLFKCQECHTQTSITAGTIMNRTKMPLKIWFWAAYLVSTDTTGFSALQFARQMGIKNYETAFQLLHKLRSGMVNCETEKLSGAIEVDETYVGGKAKGKTGRGAANKVIVAGAVENRDGKAGRIRLRVIGNAGAKALVGFVQDTVHTGQHVITDAWPAYNSLSRLRFRHEARTVGEPENASVVLPLIHLVFSNLKAWLIGTHHGVSPQHLQSYLNEFTFRFNRRKNPMLAFQSLLGLIDEREGPEYKQLYNIENGKHPAWQHPTHGDTCK